MKFDIIDALKKANSKLGHPCDIRASKDDEGYLIQIKVWVKPNEVYGQQFAFTEHEVLMDEWHLMNNKFHKALDALKLQIEEA